MSGHSASTTGRTMQKIPMAVFMGFLLDKFIISSLHAVYKVIDVVPCDFAGVFRYIAGYSVLLVIAAVWNCAPVKESWFSVRERHAINGSK